jgi:hypothetical protein
MKAKAQLGRLTIDEYTRKSLDEVADGWKAVAPRYHFPTNAR